MIATVRIAPVERWCESRWLREEELVPVFHKSVGMAVRIVTETCQKSAWCPGRAWQHEDTNVDEFRIALGLGPREWNLGPRFLCEHMLEMD